MQELRRIRVHLGTSRVKCGWEIKKVGEVIL